MLSALKARIPWRAKLAIKLIVGRFPMAYRTLHRLGLGVHGAMDDPAYVISVFQTHYSRTQAALPEDFVALELGPGDSIGSAICAHAYGASTSWLVDTGAYAATDPTVYAALVERLRDLGHDLRGVDPTASLDTLLDTCGAHYLTDGLASLRQVPDRSVDLVYSQAVLEHVHRDEFDALMRETHRCLRPSGVASHRIDLRDHLGEALNNLRFSEKFWESKLVRTSGFYTNRLRSAEILRSFEDAGFEVEIVDIQRWDRLPTPRSRLSPPFARHDDDELLIMSLDVVLRPRDRSTAPPSAE